MDLLESIQSLCFRLRRELREKHNRSVSLGDLLTDRWERAKFHGFGEGTSCYDNVLIIGDVQVGKNTWIGPNVILDGSGGLSIGDNCSISAGVQIYTHHTVKWANSMGEEAAEMKPVTIGSGVYIGPQSVIQMGVEVGDRAVIGALSFVNQTIPSRARAWGVPARIHRSKTETP